MACACAGVGAAFGNAQLPCQQRNSGSIRLAGFGRRRYPHDYPRRCALVINFDCITARAAERGFAVPYRRTCQIAVEPTVVIPHAGGAVRLPATIRRFRIGLPCQSCRLRISRSSTARIVEATPQSIDVFQQVIRDLLPKRVQDEYDNFSARQFCRRHKIAVTRYEYDRVSLLFQSNGCDI